MPQIPPVLQYQSVAQQVPRWRRVLRIIIFTCFGGLTSLLLLGYLLGDVDDYGWLFFLSGLCLGGVIGYLQRTSYLPRKFAIPIAVVSYVVASLNALGTALCLVTGSNPITGASFDGLEVLVLIVWLFASMIPATFGFLLHLMAAPKQRARAP